jgi:glycosyltransferase involved in cell wall biosynthesis
MKTAIFWEQESWGGVDTHLLTLLKYWKNNEDELVLFSNIDNQGLKRIDKDLMKLQNLSIVKYHSLFFNKSNYAFVNKFKSLLRPIFFLRSVYKYKKLLEDYDFDAILSENGGYPGSWGCLAVIFSAKMCGIKKRVLLIHHEANSPAFYQKHFENFIDKKIGRVCTDVIAVSEATKNSLYKRKFLFSSRIPIKVIYNGVDFSNYSSAKYNLRVKHKINNQKKLIGIVGRVEKYKGHEDIIYANSFLKQIQQDNIQLIFIGKGEKPEINRLKSLQKSIDTLKPFIFTGYIDDESRAIIDQLSVLCVLTKDFEGFGLTIAEAMACGIPVLATKVGAITEFVSNDVASLIEPESPRQISDFLIDFLKNEELYAKKARKAQKHIQKFSPEKMVNQFRIMLHE